MKEKVFKQAALFCAAMMLCLFAPNIAAQASAVTGLRQTSASTTSVRISFDAVAGAEGYYVYYSADNISFARHNENMQSCDTYRGEYTFLGLSAGKSYYLYVVPVYLDKDYNYIPDSSQRSAVLEIVTAPENPRSIAQTAATPDSVTFSWTEAYGASGYRIRDSYDGSVISTTAGTETTISGLNAGSHTDIYVYAYRQSASGFVAEERITFTYCYGYVAPDAPQRLADVSENHLSWRSDTGNRVTVSWDSSQNNGYFGDGYEVEIFSVDGKTKLRTIDTNTESVSFNIKKVKNRGFRIRVREYITINSSKCYGKWSEKKTVIPQAKFSLKRTGNGSVKLKWKKVANATKYTVYISDGNGSWKRAAVSGRRSTGCTVRKPGSGKYIRFMVIPTVKAGGKKYTADKTWYKSIYMSR